MLSTIKAVYCAAMEITRDDDSWSEETRDDLIQVLWLFDLQHSIIQRKGENRETSSSLYRNGERNTEGTSTTGEQELATEES